MQSSVASRMREVILSLCSAPTWNTASSSGVHSIKKAMDLPVQVQRRPEMVRGLKHLSCERLRPLESFILKK